MCNGMSLKPLIWRDALEIRSSCLAVYLRMVQCPRTFVSNTSPVSQSLTENQRDSGHPIVQSEQGSSAKAFDQAFCAPGVHRFPTSMQSAVFIQSGVFQLQKTHFSGFMSELWKGCAKTSFPVSYIRITSNPNSSPQFPIFSPSFATPCYRTPSRSNYAP